MPLQFHDIFLIKVVDSYRVKSLTMLNYMHKHICAFTLADITIDNSGRIYYQASNGIDNNRLKNEII